MARLARPVLVVEDHDDTRDAFQLMLERNGYAVVAAPNGRDALDKLQGGLRPCVILMDLMMPVMNGFEFREEQLRDADLAAIPLIAYSAVTDPLRTARHLRADAYVSKPVEVGHVLALVNQLCRCDDPSDTSDMN